MIQVKEFTFNHFQTNCYVLWDEATRECAIVDPAAEASYEDAQVTQYIEEQHLSPSYILLTHAHVDHVAGLRQACVRYGLPVTMHPDGTKLLRQCEAYGSVMGFDVRTLRSGPFRTTMCFPSARGGLNVALCQATVQEACAMCCPTSMWC